MPAIDPVTESGFPVELLPPPLSLLRATVVSDSYLDRQSSTRGVRVRDLSLRPELCVPRALVSVTLFYSQFVAL